MVFGSGQKNAERISKIWNRFEDINYNFIAIAVFEYQTGIHFPLFRVMVEEDSNGTIPLENSFLICGQIGTILIGAFPMVKWMTKTFGSILSKVGKHLE